MADATTAVYAVVDKPKNRKNRSIPKREIAETTMSGFDSPVYDMVSRAVTTPVPDQSGGMITLDNMYSKLNNTNRRETAQVANNTSQSLSQTTNRKAEEMTEKRRSCKEAEGCKIFTCIFVTITVVAIIMLVCIAILFVEISKLKNQTATNQQSPLGQQTANNSSNQQMNSSEMFCQQLFQEYSRHTQQLNSSIQTVRMQFGQDFAMNRNRTQQLNSSIQTVLMQFGQDIAENRNRTHQLNCLIHLGHCESFPAASCAALPPSSPSGYYWVRVSDGSAVRVYCDMTRSCGRVTGGWMRVAELNVTNNKQDCPSGFSERTDSAIHTCVKTQEPGCSQTMFLANDFTYSQICGSIRAYQVGSTDSFAHRNDPTIDDNYVDGVSLTHGSPRQHVWTFAAGFSEDNSGVSCPCTGSRATPPPSFVREDYFCDTGNGPGDQKSSNLNSALYFDPLWDGAGCGPQSTCCSFNNPPWFYRQLQPTTDDIEMRVCRNEQRLNEDIAIESVYLYVQ